MINSKPFFLISTTLLFTVVVSGIPSIPSIQDEIFSFPKTGIRSPRIPLKYVNGVPTVEFSIGTPQQKFTGIFDTASPITWVMSKNCTSQACLLAGDEEKYSPEESSTNSRYPFNVDLTYLDGTHIQFKPEFDVMTFGDIPLPAHLFGEAYQVDYPKGYFPPANARLGLGDFGSIVWTKLGLSIDKPKLPSNSLSNPFGRRAAGDDRYSTGSETSGSSGFRKRGPFSDPILDSFVWVLGVDEALYTGPIYQLSITPFSGLTSPFWNIPIKGFQLNYGNIPSNSAQPRNTNITYPFQSGAYGKVYSSSPYLTVPKTAADNINQAIGAIYNPDINLYTIPCTAYDTAPSLVIQFDAGVDAEISAKQYIYKLEKNEMKNAYVGNAECYSAIVGGSSDNKNVFLGGPFFRSFYLTFQFSSQKVGIAESISKAGKVYAHV